MAVAGAGVRRGFGQRDKIYTLSPGCTGVNGLSEPTSSGDQLPLSPVRAVLLCM